MIVTQYAGSKTVKVYAQATNAATATGTKAGYISRTDDDTETGDENGVDMNNVALKSEGSYYLGGTGSAPTANDSVAATAKAVEVFSYVDPGNANTAGDKTYVVWAGENKTDTGTVYSYTEVTIHVELEADGDPTTTGEVHEVTAKIPEATDYKHIHFGVWAALGEAEKDGTQKLSDLGIGFVQSIGDGLTGADMPNNGDATYSGNWVGAVQARDEDGNGPISLVNNAATLKADFEMATIDVDLTGLAELEGAIDTNTFSGTKATVGAGNMYNLDSTGKFTGSFSGGFYGAKAAEAGGIFDFTSEDAGRRCVPWGLWW